MQQSLDGRAAYSSTATHDENSRLGGRDAQEE